MSEKKKERDGGGAASGREDREDSLSLLALLCSASPPPSYASAQEARCCHTVSCLAAVHCIGYSASSLPRFASCIKSRAMLDIHIIPRISPAYPLSESPLWLFCLQGTQQAAKCCTVYYYYSYEYYPFESKSKHLRGLRILSPQRRPTASLAVR